MPLFRTKYLNSHTSIYYKNENQIGFSIIELMIVVAIISILIGIGAPAMSKYREELDISDAKNQIIAIQTAIDRYFVQYNHLPNSLADVNMDKLKDPWGSPYYYFKIADASKKSINTNARRDKFLRPVNSDFDLYSAGPDNLTKLPFTAKSAKDDIVRCNNGKFLGFAKDY